MGASGFAIGVWLRAVLIGSLAFATIEVGLHRLYATALVLAGTALVTGVELGRRAGSTDRMLAQFVDGLLLEGADRPRASPGLQHLTRAIEGVFERLGQSRLERQHRIDFSEALTDSVAAALLVVDEAGRVVRANRSSHRLFGEAEGPLRALEALGPQTAGQLLNLAAGGRDIVRLADNQSMLASVTDFSAPGRPHLRLISLQRLSGDLDLVILKSWQDLASVLAHEMMNSLTPICSLSDSLVVRLQRSPEEREEAAALTSEIVQAMEVIARRSSGLMNFVERYRRLAEMPDAVRAAVPLSAFVETLDGLTAPLMSAAGVDYASRVEPETLVVQADRDLLEQAAINLLKNALDAAAGREAAMVRLTCRLEDEQVAIIVEDNGPGLACEDAETAFVPFFTTKLGGSGVGLTLARQIALAHQGRLEHLARAPQGAIFRLRLPV